MKYQRGFIPIILLVAVFLGMTAAGGGYMVYKDKQRQNKFKEEVKLLKERKSVDEESVSTKEEVKTIEPKPVQITASVSADPINCGSNYDCIVAAAKDCKAASMTTYFNGPNPLLGDGITQISTTKHEIKKGSTQSQCVLIQTTLEDYFKINESERKILIDQGFTNEEIEGLLNNKNPLLGIPITCVSAGTNLAEYLMNVKDGKFRTSIKLENSPIVTQTMITSSGNKFECTYKNTLFKN